MCVWVLGERHNLLTNRYHLFLKDMDISTQRTFFYHWYQRILNFKGNLFYYAMLLYNLKNIVNLYVYK